MEEGTHALHLLRMDRTLLIPEFDVVLRLLTT